ncbi:MAG: hypothetical protein VYA34_10850 [Myxococcota bacterium]|nr:hypothetical protein [Myxococcota bacterium]
MGKGYHLPDSVGQLVWSQADPSLGVGVVTCINGYRFRVQFFRLEGERIYAQRSNDATLMRYLIQPGEKVRCQDGNARLIKGVAGDGPKKGEPLSYLLDDDEVYQESLL